MLDLFIANPKWWQRIAHRFYCCRNTIGNERLGSASPTSGKHRTPLHILYDDIGNFLFRHKLELTPLNFGCTHDYLLGNDHDVVAAFGDAERNGLISNGWIENYVSSQLSKFITPDALERLLAAFDRELEASLYALAASVGRSEGFSNALADCTSQEDDRTIAHRLLTLTQEMVKQARLAEIEMRTSHARIHHLQTTLKAARLASKTDPLTGLSNRRGFERSVRQALAENPERPITIAICDLDHFKAVNDNFGHETGDRVLCYFAQQLKRFANVDREVARLGGEEFGIMLVGDTLESAANAIHKIRETMAARTLRDRTTNKPIGAVTFSAGLADLTAGGDLPATMRRADSALYAAKRNGRNQLYGAYGSGSFAGL